MLYALLGAAIIGLSLGLLGGGGSILTVPVLTYLLHHPKAAAIDEAFAIVGLISLGAALRTAHQGRVRWEWVLIFGVAGVFGAVLGEAIVEHISASLRFILLAAVMITAATLMLRPPPARPAPRQFGPVLLVLMGVGFGALTKVVGVGGGFLIVPTLVVFGGLTMHAAIGTSLPIIALNSASSLGMSLARDWSHAARIDWLTVALFGAVGIAASLLGTSISHRVNQRLLRRIFAVFLLAVAGYILWQELPRVLG